MHDHTKRGKRYCPLMKEMCNQGWTVSMGKDDEGLPLLGVCAAWQPVTIYKPNGNSNEEIHDCSQFGWNPDLLTAIAQESNQGAASADKVATEVAKFHATSLAMLPENEIQTIAVRRPELMPAVPDPKPPHNGNKQLGEGQ